MSKTSILKDNVFKTTRDDESIWMYHPKKGYFVKAETYVREHLARDASKYSNARYNDLLGLIKGRTYANREEFGDKDGFINLRNGILNIKKKELLSHSPSYKFISRLEIDYNPDVECQLFNEMIDIVPEINKLQPWFAYHLLPEHGQQKVAMFLPGKADSGRTTILNILQAFVGIEYTSHFQLRELSDPITIAGLYGMKANIHADLSYTQIKDVSGFKTITGGDFVTGRMVYAKPIHYKPHVKLTFASNKLPDLYIDVLNDEAWWNRVAVIEFPNSIQMCNRKIGISDEIIEKELSGVLNWALDAYGSSIDKSNNQVTWLSAQGGYP